MYTTIYITSGIKHLCNERLTEARKKIIKQFFQKKKKAKPKSEENLPNKINKS
jgi:hypothetical protein